MASNFFFFSPLFLQRESKKKKKRLYIYDDDDDVRGQSVFVSLNCPGSINHTLDTRPKIKKKGATKRLKQKYTWRLDGI